VQADEDARDRDNRGARKEKRADPPPAYQSNGEGDGEGGNGMVARKRRLV
jgi:hypothetical protein